MADGSMDCNRYICDYLKYNRCYKTKLEKHSEVADFRQDIAVHCSPIHNNNYPSSATSTHLVLSLCFEH